MQLKISSTIEMPPIYPFEIKMHVIFLQNGGQSKLQKKIAIFFCNVFAIRG